MRAIDLNTAEFINLLASDAPAPGGGGAAAVAGALGTALSHMVGALTVGKKKYAPVEPEIRALMDRCDALQRELLEQVQADEEGFRPLAQAYGIPKDDPGREEILERASADACQAPLRIMELCGESLEAAAVLAEKGSRLAVSDAGCAAALLRGAMESASLNVFVNTRTMKDRGRADELNRRCQDLLDRGVPLAGRILQAVRAELGGCDL